MTTATTLAVTTEELVAQSISITARGKDLLVVYDPKTGRINTITWMALSNVEPGLKYRTECISHLMRMVEAEADRDVKVDQAAEALIERATIAACVLY